MDHSHHHTAKKQPVEAKQEDKYEHHQVDQTAVDKHAGHHTENFLKRFWICLALTFPVLFLSNMIQQWVGFQFSFPGDKYLLLLLSSIIYFYGGWPFLVGLIREIRNKMPGMMTLVAVAITTAYVYSVAVVFGFEGMDFFWELSTLIDIMLLGHWLEMKSQMTASRALESLVQLMPSQVHVEEKGLVIDKPLKDLRTGNIVVIKPGEKIPADGHVIEGESYVNESMLTGESVPVKKEKGNNVIGGSVNGDGALKVNVSGAGENSYLTKVINMVQSAQGTKSRTQNLANKVAMWLTIVSLTVGVFTLIAWLTAGKDFSFALERMVTVMVTSCPHALGVAIPLVVAISTSISAIHGLLIRNRTAFENARKLTTVIFDKTGTLTKGSHEIQRILSLNGEYTSAQILQFAAAIQQNSEHHIARGVMRKVKEEGLKIWPSTDFKYLQGVGVMGTVDGKKVVAAGPNYFKQLNQNLPDIPHEIDQSTETVNFVVVNGKPIGIITFADAIRDSSGMAIEELKKMRIKSFLLTGDNDKVAAAIAKKLNMDGYLANVLPHEKLNKVKEFQDKGEIVAMTGDGVNDAPALAQADVGIAVGSGTDVAAETADIILVNSDPRDVVQMIKFGRSTYQKMIQNLLWAVGYNIVAIPLAAGILYPTFVLSPALGAVLMSASTIIVALNAQLLKAKMKN